MNKGQILKPLEVEATRVKRSPGSAHRRLRVQDITALRRMRCKGPLTIPQAYDCGHTDNETTGHGMNRLVAAALAVFHGWSTEDDDAVWIITERGKRVLDANAH